MSRIGDRQVWVTWINGSKAIALATSRGMEAGGSYWDHVEEHEIEENRRFASLGLAKGWGKRYGVGLDDFGAPRIDVQVYGHEDADYPTWDTVESWEWQETEWVRTDR